MLIFANVDIMGGKCVRLRQGRFDEETVFSDDPAAMAKRWIDQGAEYLHVVDLDGSRSGEPCALEQLKKITALGRPVQIGGGYRSIDNINAALQAGAARVILGSRIAVDKSFAKQVMTTFGEQIVIGIDTRDGKVAIHGWQTSTDLNAPDFAREMEQLGARRIVFTDIARDGILSGPNFSSIAQMVSAVKIPVIAAGGVSTLEDVRRLTETGVEGCVIGRALFSGDISLPEAIAIGKDF